jgi:CRISPR/Cas system-associated exonuclease Cas4 (RecB family)
LEIVTSPSAAARLAAVRRFLAAHSPSTELLIVAASRGAADDVARAASRATGATFGWTRCSLTELAARAVATAHAGQRRLPASMAAAEALAARAVFEARGQADLAYFEPVASTPGFPRALTRTLHELRLAQVPAEQLAGGGAAEQDMARLMTRVEDARDQAAIEDRAALFVHAAGAWRSGRAPWVGLPMVLLDVTIDSLAERTFVDALVAGAPSVLATVPHGERRALDALIAMGGTRRAEDDTASSDTDLAHLRRYIFTSEPPPVRDRAGDVELFSAPGEGREAVEIVRRVLDEAAAGVPFDEMAVFLRTPQQYQGLHEHACVRGGVPVYFDRGTRRPDPAGRAFVALLSCAVEGLSARRFDEYLSLGQVPNVGMRKPARQEPVRPDDEAFGFVNADRGSQDPDEENADTPHVDSDDEAVVAGTLRSPWKWEELIVESSVVGGRSASDGGARWRRRLDGLAASYRIRLAALAREEPDSPRVARLVRDLRNLTHLRAFALPIVDRLAGWPDAANWAEWLERFEALAAEALARPERVLTTLADFRPMGAVGPVTLEEARDVLHDRLITLDRDPPARRHGRLFVGTPHQARGRSFRVVFVPGLAERVVPQRPREDPLLLDTKRRAIDGSLLRQDDRSSAERLLLRLAIGSASERLYLSYPRMDVGETRARVPSFYALDVMRAITGQVPDYRLLASRAAEAAGASLAWPAPEDPDRAIDDLEHDLAVLRPLLDARDQSVVKGRAHYMLALNESLTRSVRSRWKRDQKPWSSSDGLARTTPAIAAALDRQRLGNREYSLSALQQFAACPYKFLLSTIHRLEPWEEPEPLTRLDPLTRGSLFHTVQTEFYRVMAAAGELPVTDAGVADAVRVLDEVLDRVAARYADDLVPAIDRVWRDEIGELRRDLSIWVRRLAGETVWLPEYFELSFGLRDEGRDPRSLADAVTIDGRFRLRGSVDLIERHRDSGILRVTDHKTGRNRAKEGMLVDGGAVLQPILYSVAIEEGLGATVAEGRLFYCTTAGGFSEHAIPIDDHARKQGLQVLEIVDRAIEQGFLVAAPAARACTWCDFRPICGPREEERARRKAKEPLEDLAALRSLR